uniref:Interleukin-1 beta n=1 Tax=Cairina moschata TaxID=8855 RepID=A0A8C3CDS6_CAIMO
MAFVPDLDVLEGSSLSEETFYGPDCLYPQKKLRLDSEAKHSQSHTTVDVQVMVTQGHGARRFRQAATLVVAATKMLRRPSHKDFADSDLGGFLEEIFEPVTFQQLESSYAGAPVYRYTRSQSFDIFDINQKCFVLESPTQLVALHLQGPSASRKVRLNIALYRPHTRQGSAGAMQMPVALGIKGYKLYMSCVMSGTEPVLQLEVSAPNVPNNVPVGMAPPSPPPPAHPRLVPAAGSRRHEGHRQRRADPLHLLPPRQPGRGHHALRVGRLPRLVRLHLAAAPAARGHHQPARPGQHRHLQAERALSRPPRPQPQPQPAVAGCLAVCTEYSPRRRPAARNISGEIAAMGPVGPPRAPRPLLWGCCPRLSSYLLCSYCAGLLLIVLLRLFIVLFRLFSRFYTYLLCCSVILPPCCSTYLLSFYLL